MVNKYARVMGGADQNYLALCRTLVERGHGVKVLSTAGPGNVVREGAFVDPRVTHQTRERLTVLQQLEVFANAIWNRDAAQAMQKLIEDFRPDVVHLHKLYPQLSVAPAVVAARAGLPIVQTLHDYELLSASALDDSGGWVDREESRAAYRTLNTATFPLRRALHVPRVAAFIACSSYVAGRYRAKLDIDATVLPYFIEPPDRGPARFTEREGVMFVGRLTEEKGVRDVIELAAAVPDVRLAIVGYGPLEAVVDDAQRRIPNLEFLGRQDRPAILRLLARSRVFLMPSRWQEPGGIAALEAMSMGTPVIAYANGGLAEYVSNAQGGVAIEPSVAKLGETMRLIHDDESRWSEYSRRGIEGVARLHTADAYLPRLEDLYSFVRR